jgi:predicted nucleic acid-binding protein
VITIDASVLVAAAIRDEPAHPAAVAAIARIRDANLAVHEPAIALVEVTSGVARRTGNVVLARGVGETMLAMPNLIVHALDTDEALHAATLAAALRLRGADAVYTAVAIATGSTLLTFDIELTERAGGTVSVMSPETWMAQRDLEAAYVAAEIESTEEDKAAWEQALGDGLDG